MLASLSIENFALIDRLSIGFEPGFSIITGETGAGKSILLGALALALGKRADLSALNDKEKKCIVEAKFNIADYNLQEFFLHNDLDYEDQTIIRRELLPSGKSRAFINDTPVTLQALAELSDYLIDVHSQHETRELSDEDFQFRIVDALAGNVELLTRYAQTLRLYKSTNSQILQMRQELSASLKEQDYNAFLLNELTEASLTDGEQQQLESELEMLSNIGTIAENFSLATALADDEQFGISKSLRELRNALQKTAPFSEGYKSIYERAESLLIEFDDLVLEVSSQSEKLSSDPQRLDAVSQKLQTIYNLQKKHQVSSVAELLAIEEQLSDKALSLSGLEDRISELEVTIEKLSHELLALAGELSANRRNAIPVLSNQLSEKLQLLGMPNVRFKIEVEPVDEFRKNGRDSVKFLFSANKGSDFGLLKKVASGGEMSRIMLAVKSILAQYSKLPVIIFDEIDTGVSGEIADKMGAIMKQMSASMQVFAITHLPQIAAKGDTHFRVFKTVDADRTVSGLTELTSQQRIEEIARMLSGSAVSESAINHAKALLQ